MNPSWQIQIVRSIWTQMWQTMMGRLAPSNDGGEYLNPGDIIPPIPDLSYLDRF